MSVAVDESWEMIQQVSFGPGYSLLERCTVLAGLPLCRLEPFSTFFVRLFPLCVPSQDSPRLAGGPSNRLQNAAPIRQ